MDGWMATSVCVSLLSLRLTACRAVNVIPSVLLAVAIRAHYRRTRRCVHRGLCRCAAGVRGGWVGGVVLGGMTPPLSLCLTLPSVCKAEAGADERHEFVSGVPRRGGIEPRLW